MKANIDTEKEILLIGDFNFDYKKLHVQNYSQRKLYDEWLTFIDELGLVQKVKNTTWTRTVENTIRHSTLDHAYTNVQPLTVDTIDVNLGDHQGLVTKSSIKTTTNTEDIYTRSWKNYSKSNLLIELRKVNWQRFDYMNTEEKYFYLNHEILRALHKLAPERLIKHQEKRYCWSEKLLEIKRKKHRLLVRAKKTKNANLYRRARDLDKDFRKQVEVEKRRKLG